MKTFETEKHNIPEGATHYWNETKSGFFAWWRDDTKQMLCPERHTDWTNQRDISDDLMHEIPQTKEVTMNTDNIEVTQQEEEAFNAMSEQVEWENGDACFCTALGENLNPCVYVGMDGNLHVFRMANGLYESTIIDYLSKPETEAEKLKRERLESAYDLFLTASASTKSESIFTFDEFKRDDVEVKCWLAIVDKTNYRKGVKV